MAKDSSTNNCKHCEKVMEYLANWISNPVANGPGKRLYSIQEAAKYLGRGPDSVRELIYAKELPIIKRGEDPQRGKVWIDVRDLDSWIEGHKRGN